MLSPHRFPKTKLASEAVFQKIKHEEMQNSTVLYRYAAYREIKPDLQVKYFVIYFYPLRNVPVNYQLRRRKDAWLAWPGVAKKEDQSAVEFWRTSRSSLKVFGWLLQTLMSEEATATSVGLGAGGGATATRGCK